MGDTSVVVAVEEVDDGSFDPDGPEDVVDIRIASPNDTENPDDPYTVTFTDVGQFTVTLTIEDSQGQTSSADCTVTVYLPEPTQADLTWSGGAGVDRSRD